MEFECCWFNSGRSPLECPNIEEGEEYLYTSQRKRLVEKCLNCPSFRRDLEKIPEENELRNVVSILREEYLDQQGHLHSLSAFLSSKSREIKFLHELSMVLQTSMELDEVLSVAMTAITSGKGFGMNRAFLLMTDQERMFLRGHIGVGPRNYEEAWEIWDEVDRSNFSLAELSRQFYKTKLSSEKAKFQDILEKLTVSLHDKTHIFNRALRERRPILVENAFHNPDVDPALASILGVDHFLVMPLISRNRSIGVLLTDNFVTNKLITPRDMQSLQTFAFPVAFAIERASLYERLQEEVEKQMLANQKLHEQQELIVRMEKMAVVGRITATIAHSIRNPLAAIGGYARALLKNSASLEQKRGYLENIVTEAGHLDDVLHEVLSYSDSLHPVMDYWDLNQLAIAVTSELQGILDEKEIALDLNLDADLPAVWLDYKQISYCLKTIINHVAINQPQVDRIEVQTSRDRDTVTICVSDNGLPLTTELKEALIIPFTAIEKLGMGVGLPLCKVILERHGSSFAIEDRPGGGNRYCIILQQKKEEKSL
ncbi:MAG TPA: histidine kinase dimerization/phospho-acceptor domain-containing protein [Geobacteraceae bacterium]|nr:histidine kinase dimerization/phospho-acceptor domain-containing protein [Geobacteraceae bacterium]